MFKGFSVWEIILLGAAMLLLFFVIYGITTLIGKALKFSTEDLITAVFCGSKKSLVHGTVMAKVLFTGFSGLGLILLPLMMFHALQLVASSIIAQRFSRREA
jgi:sodium/bile acid cotransporter 7